MPDPKPEAKTLEMRVAELEDRLSKMHVTEDELKAYHKVSALVNAPQAGCVVDCSGCINECAIRACSIRPCIVRYCTIIRYCTYECGGGCAPGGGGFSGGGGGGFGGFGG